MIRIVIAGNPNSGKTTFFNCLSGKNERVGNWAGVTVSIKEANLKRRYNPLHEQIIVVDLPGAYNMDAYTNDELEATSFIQNNNIDAIINVVDATNLERSLFFTTQLIDIEVPVIIAINKSDITKRRKTKIDTKKLSELLGVPVHFTQATSKRGLFDVITSALNEIEKKGNHEKKFTRKKQTNQRHRFRGTGKECKNYRGHKNRYI